MPRKSQIKIDRELVLHRGVCSTILRLRQPLWPVGLHVGSMFSPVLHGATYAVPGVGGLVQQNGACAGRFAFLPPPHPNACLLLTDAVPDKKPNALSEVMHATHMVKYS